LREATEQEPLRIAVIGLGPHWSNRYRPLLDAPDRPIQVVSVFDPVPHRAQTEADRIRARAEIGLRAAIQRPDVEAVLVPDRSWFGAWPVAEALRAGRAVLSALSIDELAGDLEPGASDLEAASTLVEIDTVDPSSAAFKMLRQWLQNDLAERNQTDGPRDLGAIQAIGLREIVEDVNVLNHSLLERLAFWLFELGEVDTGEEATAIKTQHISKPKSGGLRFDATLERPEGPLRLRAWLEPTGSNRPTGFRTWARAERGWVMIDHAGTLSWRDKRGRGSEPVQRAADAKAILQSFRQEVRGGVSPSNRLPKLLGAIRLAKQILEQTKDATNQTAS